MENDGGHRLRYHVIFVKILKFIDITIQDTMLYSNIRRFPMLKTVVGDTDGNTTLKHCSQKIIKIIKKKIIVFTESIKTSVIMNPQLVE